MTIGNHTITGNFRLEKSHVWDQTGLLQALSTCIWKTSKNRDCAASLSNLFYCLFLLVGKIITLYPLWSSLSAYACCFTFSCPAALWSAWLHLLHDIPTALGGCCHIPWSYVFPRQYKPRSPSLTWQENSSAPSNLDTRVFSTELLPKKAVSSLWDWKAFMHTRGRSCHLSLLNFKRFLSIHPLVCPHAGVEETDNRRSKRSSEEQPAQGLSSISSPVSEIQRGTICQDFSCMPLTIKDWNSRWKASAQWWDGSRAAACPAGFVSTEHCPGSDLVKPIQTARGQGSQSVSFCRESARSLGRQRHATSSDFRPSVWQRTKGCWKHSKPYANIQIFTWFEIFNGENWKTGTSGNWHQCPLTNKLLARWKKKKGYFFNVCSKSTTGRF